MQGVHSIQGYRARYISLVRHGTAWGKDLSACVESRET